ARGAEATVKLGALSGGAHFGARRPCQGANCTIDAGGRIKMPHEHGVKSPPNCSQVKSPILRDHLWREMTRGCVVLAQQMRRRPVNLSPPPPGSGHVLQGPPALCRIIRGAR